MKYEAVLVDKSNNAWMVHRWPASDSEWNSDMPKHVEALIWGAFETPEAAIQAAIKRGSWA
jgi:citrate lyase beta subunit